MNKTSRWILAIFVLAVTGVAFAVSFLDAGIERGLEIFLNQSQKELFAGTLDLHEVHLDRSFRLHIGRVTGVWQTLEGEFPIEIEDIETRDPLTNILRQEPVRIGVLAFRPQGSKSPGISAEAIVHMDPAGTFEMRADFLGLDLGEFEPLDPENLRGATGILTGQFFLKTQAEGEQEFRMDLKVQEPGGHLQARFFDLFLPYLPPASQKVLEKVRKERTVDYRNADFSVKLGEPGTINVLLRILVPDYNLNLNLNLVIRVEDNEALGQLAQVMGLVKVKVS
ncbi:MAG: hypothetical protein ACOY3K_03830 [Candidatus Omnitrophota bacterium]